ncbi:MAG: hypothetical protein ABSH46_20085 [Bryobacteraceae bacterium]
MPQAKGQRGHRSYYEGDNQERRSEQSPVADGDGQGQPESANEAADAHGEQVARLDAEI